MNGYIKLNRSIKKHWIFQDANYLKYWIDMLMEANWKENKTLWRGELITVKRGCFPMSFRSFAERWSTSPGKVQRYITLLKNDKMVDTDTSNGFTLVKINNYDRFQGGNDTVVDTVTDTVVDTVTDTVTDTTLRKKRNKEIKEINMRDKPRTLLQIFGDEFLNQMGIEYHASFAKDGKLLKELEKHFGRDAVIHGIKYFFEKYIHQNKFASNNVTVGGMKYVWNSMIAKIKLNEKPLAVFERFINE